MMILRTVGGWAPLSTSVNKLLIAGDTLFIQLLMIPTAFYKHKSVTMQIFQIVQLTTHPSKPTPMVLN
jgi:hypothetical protein